MYFCETRGGQEAKRVDLRPGNKSTVKLRAFNFIRFHGDARHYLCTGCLRKTRSSASFDTLHTRPSSSRSAFFELFSFYHVAPCVILVLRTEVSTKFSSILESHKGVWKVFLWFFFVVWSFGRLVVVRKLLWKNVR